MFQLSLLQAVSDWQRDGDHEQKLKRGNSLKACVSGIDQRFRTCDALCFRQEAHETDRTFKLLAGCGLPERIASWTLDLEVAKNLKNGVPPEGLQGVIFSIIPPKDSVVVNLDALYSDPEFCAAMEKHKSKINYYQDGAGKWMNSQREVIIELENLNATDIECYGGYAGDIDHLVVDFVALHHHFPTENNLLELSLRAGKAWWLSKDGTQSVLKRMQPRIEAIKKNRRLPE